MTAVDDPSRFRRSRDVAAYFGLTSRRWQSGTSIDVQGRISKAGDGDVLRACKFRGKSPPDSEMMSPLVPRINRPLIPK